MAHDVLSIACGVNDDEFTQACARLEKEAAARLMRASNQFAVDLLKRAKQLVPFGPKGTYSERDPDTGKRRYQNKRGPGHPGKLQRSGHLTSIVMSATEWQRSIVFDVPYAHYQHTGMNRHTKYSTPLTYSRPERQANYVYQSGKRSSERSPLQEMLKLGRFGDLVMAA